MARAPSRPEPPDAARPSGRRGNIAALIAIALVAAALLWTVSALQSHNALQNCIDSGRRDCVATPTGSDP